MKLLHYSVVVLKLGIIHAALIHIHLIQTLKILTQKVMIDNVKLGKYHLHHSILCIKRFKQII